jgi:molybdate/tungstate transport system substrate-binding protein
MLLVAIVAASCGSPASSSATQRGEVDVFYAGSLVNLMEKNVGPAFSRDSGYTFTGFAAGSKALAAEIKGKVRIADVFISASPAVNTTLMGDGNGDWLSWYATFARSSLVLGYNQRSRFAAQLQTRPWHSVITEPGFRLGRTDPATDPKGQFTVQALNEAAQRYQDPALLQISRDSRSIFPEETLVGRLQAGQLDAGFFYTIEAVQARIPAVPLTPIDVSASYTVSVVNRSPHREAALAFVDYLLGSKGLKLLTAQGLTLVQPPQMSGGSLPEKLRGVIPAS